MNVMKLESLFLPALLLFGTEIWVRVVTQGIKLGLLSVAIESSISWITTSRRKLFEA
jgi:hypothetical protein